MVRGGVFRGIKEGDWEMRAAGILRVEFLLFLFAAAALAGCGGKAGVGGPGKANDFKYDMSDDGLLTYRSTTEAVQKMKIQAMEMEVTNDKRLVFSIRELESDDGNCRLAVSVDSLEINVNSAQGSVSADASDVIGKSFDMVISRTGRGIDLSGAEALEYDMGMAGRKNLAAEFTSLFPEFAGRPVGIGETWTSTDTISVKEGGGEMRVITEAVSTLEGFEEVNGVECARISSVITGTLSGEGEQGGAKLAFDGTISGNEVWHFDYKNGLLVDTVSESTVHNTIQMSGPQEMEIPVIQTSKTTLTLIGAHR